MTSVVYFDKPNEPTSHGGGQMFSKGFHRIPAISLVVCVCVLVSFRGCTEVPGDGNAGDSGAAIADAGEDQTVLENALVVLDGSSSFDPDGQDLSFQWSLVSGPLITFVGSRTSHPTFVAPSLGNNLTLEIKLEVGSGLATAEDSTTIHVVQVEGELPSRMCDDPDLPLHPFVEFIVEPVDGPGPLTIDCTAITSDGSELLSGTNVLYTWTVNGEADSGPMETHAKKSFVLSSSGAHTVTLCLTISGLSWGCLDAQNAGQLERTVFVWPRISGVVHDGTEGIPGVVVAANNVPGGATDVTDSQGRYELSVSPGWSGVITPYHVNYDFQPASLEQVETTTSVSSQDFVASSSGSTDNGVYGPEDLYELLGSWGPCEGCPYDLNGDDEIDEEDLAILLANWGGLDDGSVPDPSDPLEQCSSELDCDDGNFCNGPETCVDSACRAGLDPCPAQVCDEAGEACVDCLADSDCDDGRFCNGAEDCVSGLCEAGSNPCSGQLCDEDTDSCFDQACSVDADCDDNLFCNGTETCVNGLCTSDSAPCVGQQCDEDSATCVECLVDADCDDSVFCNGAETCQASSCVPGTDPCPGQMCDGLGDVCADCLRNSDCDDAVYCNGAERCQSGSCIDGTAPCSGQSCDEDSDSCTCSTDADCDDGNDCTDDTCDPFTGCQYTNDDTNSCDDNNECTENDACSGGQCISDPIEGCETGTRYYVDGANGSDGNSGTEGDPFKTIQRGFNVANPGDSVIIKPGTYPEQLELKGTNRTGAPGAPITIRSENWYPNAAHDRALNVIVTAERSGNNAAYAVLVSDNQQHIILRGLILQQAASSNLRIANSHSITVEDCVSQDALNVGIEVSSGAGPEINIAIRRCIIQGNGDSGLRMRSQVNTVLAVVDSVAEDCDFIGNGIIVTENGEGCAVSSKGNIPDQNRCRNVRIRRCLAYRNISSHIVTQGSLEFTIEDCIAWGSTTIGDADGRSLGMFQGRGAIVRRTVSFDTPRVALFVSAHPQATGYNNTIFDNGFTRPGENPTAKKGGFGIDSEDLVFRNNCTFDNAFTFDWDPDPSSLDFRVGSSTPNLDSDYNFIKDGVGMGNHGSNSLTVDPSERSVPDNGFLVVNKATARQLADSYADAADAGTASWAMREQFISDIADALRPAAGSPLIDAGGFLVFTTSSGVNTTLIPVDRDPHRFFRLGILSIAIKADTIQIDDGDGEPGTMIRVRIASMTANSITVEAPVSFSAGAGIHTPYTGNAPDIGAFEAAQ